VKPIVILAPAPQHKDRIFSDDAYARLQERFTVVDMDGVPELEVDSQLESAFAVIGQIDLDRDRLSRASHLRAIINVEGNFLPNIDYAFAFKRGIRVLGSGTAYASAVSEYAVGMALDLARGISREDRAARAGRERYFRHANADSILLGRANVGIVGFGNLGRATASLLQGFRPEIHVHDPWLPDAVISEFGANPGTLHDVLRVSEFLFVFATATPDSSHLLNKKTLAFLPDNARVLLLSRAPVVDYDALLEELESGRLYAGIDVWPEEPIPADSPFRSLDNVILSAHRAGAIPQAHRAIGDMVLDDLELMARGVAPMRLQQALPEVVGLYQNRPVAQ